jgi:hypothetical protein
MIINRKTTQRLTAVEKLVLPTSIDSFFILGTSILIVGITSTFEIVKSYFFYDFVFFMILYFL